MTLGAAGCKWTVEEKFCEAMINDLVGFACSRYGIALREHNGEPVRADKCGEDAANEAWRRQMDARNATHNAG